MDRENNENYTEYSVEEIGQVQIADDVISVIAGLAATEVDGVAKMSGNITNEIVSKLGMNRLSNGVKTSIRDGKVYVTLNLIIDYGVSIPKTSAEVQERVKNAIDTMTGLETEEVNVHIAGISLDD